MRVCKHESDANEQSEEAGDELGARSNEAGHDVGEARCAHYVTVDLFPCYIIGVDLSPAPVSETGLVLLRQALCALLSPLVGIHAVFVKAQEVSIEAALHQGAENAREAGNYKEGEQDGCHVNVLVASLQVVLHSHRPFRLSILLRDDRVSEAELLIVLGLLLEVIEVERLVAGPLPGDLLILGKRARLNLEPYDASMEGVLDCLSLHNDIPVVVKNVLEEFIIFVVDKLANWNARLVVCMNIASFGIPHDCRRRQPIDEKPVMVVCNDCVLEVRHLEFV